jgi:hypothetical protein
LCDEQGEHASVILSETTARKNKPPASFESWQAAVIRSPPAQVLANETLLLIRGCGRRAAKAFA